MKLLRVAAAAAAGMIVSMSTAWSQEISAGQREFESNCAVCHGKTGKGDGPVAQVLIQTVPDLTVLSKANGGVFPVARMYEVIDGRAAIVAHGLRDMPVWGYEYAAEAAAAMRVNPDQDGNAEALVQARILTLIEYLETLQAE